MNPDGCRDRHATEDRQRDGRLVHMGRARRPRAFRGDARGGSRTISRSFGQRARSRSPTSTIARPKLRGADGALQPRRPRGEASHGRPTRSSRSPVAARQPTTSPFRTHPQVGDQVGDRLEMSRSFEEAANLASSFVRSRRLELPHPCGYQNLNLARLPVPPRPLVVAIQFFEGWTDTTGAGGNSMACVQIFSWTCTMKMLALLLKMPGRLAMG